jgi:hypothetical protein
MGAAIYGDFAVDNFLHAVMTLGALQAVRIDIVFHFIPSYLDGADEIV